MKLIKSIVFTIAIGLTLVSYAQETQVENESTTDKKTYYQKRAIEDANYEQQFNSESKAEEEAFWKEQKNYEKDLKKKDRKAHRAYTKEKKRAYASHYEHCDHHCHHSDYYYSHASFYYYRNDRYPQRSRTINTGVSIRTPSIRLGIGIL
jgi:hypothetical protein